MAEAIKIESMSDHGLTMDKYYSDITLLTDPNTEDEQKLKIVQTLNENFEMIVNSIQYPTFLEHMIEHFTIILIDGEPYFIAEYHIFQVRKLVLEMIYRLPCNEFLKPHVNRLVTLCMNLIKTDNEQNGITCIRIIVELKNNFRSRYNAEIGQFLQHTNKIYRDASNNIEKLFSLRIPQKLHINDLSQFDLNEILDNTYSTIVINCATGENNIQMYNIIPRSISSLKILQEVPIAIVLIYNLYKDQIEKELTEYVSTLIWTISLSPSMFLKLRTNYNEDILIEFMSVQIKALSFIAFVIKQFINIAAVYSPQLAAGIIGMFESCPSELTHLRRELLIASRCIINTELQKIFIPYVDKLLDENTLLGQGWTSTEHLKPLAYSTIADLIYHVRNSLSLPTIVKAINIFAISVHDHSLTPSIQLVCCKMLMHLVDCIKNKNYENIPNLKSTYGETVDLLMRILQVYVVKLKVVSKIYIPDIISKNTINTMTSKSPQTLDFNEVEIIDDSVQIEQKELSNSVCGKKLQENTKCVFSTSSTALISLQECKTLVKVIMCGIKSAAWGIATVMTNKEDELENIPKLPVKPQFVKMYVSVIKWSLQAMDVDMINPINNENINTNVLRPRSKDKNDAMEHLNNIFSLLPQSTFKEILSNTIAYFVERVEKNHALMYISESLLNNSLNISSIFATLLLENLLTKMEVMGNGNAEQSNLYIKLFKQVFDTVIQLNSIDSEQTLRPYLNQIVNGSMKLALIAKDPYNYFLLLRHLFHCIESGAHGVLYQEFLPLFLNLLKYLNSLQSGLHRQDMKDLTVELCLTLPVRLSLLLPHLNLLMDPLVSALNGSPSLIIQGLRTLELFVDNLQIDFLYGNIQPVRAKLMQALWRLLHNTNDNVYSVAFRILGKFGGNNRKMMADPQRLNYSMQRQSTKPAIIIKFNEHIDDVTFNVDMAIETAAESIKTLTDPYYLKKCWLILESFLAASLSSNNDISVLMKFFSHSSFKEGKISNCHSTVYIYPDPVVRNTYIMALNGIFVSATNKELKNTAHKTLFDVVMHYTMVAISQQAGPLLNSDKTETCSFGMDPFVLIDSMANVMSFEDKELLKPARVALTTILNTATVIMGSKARACQLPYMEYMVTKLCSLCYESAWYTKSGGCYAIQFFYSNMSSQWVFQHLKLFVKAQLFVLMDLSGDVSYGVLDKAKKNLKNMVVRAASPLDQNSGSQLQALQKKAIHEVTNELICQVTSSNDLLRNYSTHLLSVIASAQGITVTEVMECHKEGLSEIITLRKHLLRHQEFKTQIGMMEGNTFCTSLLPRLYTIDLNIKEHKLFYHEVFILCESSDSALSKLPGYKTLNPEQMLLLRQAGMRALTAFYYIPEVNSKIFHTLYGALHKNNPDLQETAFQCLRKFVSTSEIDMPMVHKLIKKQLEDFDDYRSITLCGAKRLWYLVQLFPTSFCDKFCTHLMELIKKMFEVLMQMKKGISMSGNYESIIVIIIEMYKQLPVANYSHIESLCWIVLQYEKILQVSIWSPFHVPLLGCLLKYPTQIVQRFLEDNYIKEPNWVNYLHIMIANDKCQPIQEALKASGKRLEELISTSYSDSTNVIEYETIRIINSIVRLDKKWIYNQTDLIKSLSQLWASDNYQERFLKPGYSDFSHWNEPKMLAKVLLQYFIHNPNQVDLLFYLMKAFCFRFISDFQFLRIYLEETVAKTFSPQWKRTAFFRFVEIFQDDKMSNHLKSKILKYIILPSVSISYENNEQQVLIHGTSDSLDSTENIVTLYIYQLITHEVPPGIAQDSIRIHLLQLGCILVNDFRVNKECVWMDSDGLCANLKGVMSYTLPCVLEKSCVDPTVRYSGHLLLAHIITSYHVKSQIILQVFHELLKAYHIEERIVVQQALDLIIPALPTYMNNGRQLLCQYTKTIIIKEAHLMQQLFHVFHLVVRHYNVYYPIRHRFVQHMLIPMQRISYMSSSNFEHKKLIVKMAEVIIKWELQQIRDENYATQNSMEKIVKIIKFDHSTPLQPDDTDKDIRINKNDFGIVFNFLAKFACEVTDGVSGSMAELLSKQCIALLRIALKSEIIMSRCIDMLKLEWMEKVFCNIPSLGPAHNNPDTVIAVANIESAFDILECFLTTLPKEQFLNAIKPLQKSLYKCISTCNTKIGQIVHTFVTCLVFNFPMILPYLNELEELYTSINLLVEETLNDFVKNESQNYNLFLTCIIMVKAISANNEAYINNLSSRFVRVLQKLCREQSQSTNTESSIIIRELVIQILDLMKNTVTNMHIQTRKIFIESILVGLIEETNDSKIMKTILKILEEWMCNPNKAPNVLEISILLVNIMQHIEKKFPDLNAQYLDIIIHIYKDKEFCDSVIKQELEAAFLSGLRCSQPAVREKFFTLFNQQINTGLPDCLLYILSSQNWEPMVTHYWIKQCIELLLARVDPNFSVTFRDSISSTSSKLPKIIESFNYCDTSFIQEILNTNEDIEVKSEYAMVIDQMMTNVIDVVEGKLGPVISRHIKFIHNLKSIKLGDICSAIAQLCHMNTSLAEKMWVVLFPAIWELLSSTQKAILLPEINQFIMSGIHVVQRDAHPSVLSTFFEAVLQCQPKINFIPSVLLYIGKSHNLWHRITLTLEKMKIENDSEVKTQDCNEFESKMLPQKDIIDALTEMYKQLKEEDMWACIWQNHAQYQETKAALALEQQGLFDQASTTYESVIKKFQNEYSNSPASVRVMGESYLWESQWIRCSKELNKWDSLLYYSKINDVNPSVMLDSAWHVPDWYAMREALNYVDYSCPTNLLWKMYLYRGFLDICHPDEPNLPNVTRNVEIASIHVIKEWRRLPHIVSHIHLPYLQASQQIIELSEAARLHQELQEKDTNSSLKNIKIILKTWKNRLPVIADDLSHWSDLFVWRQHHYQLINKYFSSPEQSTNEVLGVHASAQSIIHFGKISRKHNLTDVCLETLFQLYSIPNVPVIDCFHKIKHQVKCYMQRVSTSSNKHDIKTCLEIIEKTNIKYFPREIIAEFYALKGMFLSQIGQSQDANKAFSAAVQLHDSMVKAWGLWGEFIEDSFTKSYPNQTMQMGVSAIVCYLQACRQQNESKSRKYLANVLWLLTYDKEHSLISTIEQHLNEVPLEIWLPWIPQLLTILASNEGSYIQNLIIQIGKLYPQAVYFPIRTLYLTHKIKFMERYKNTELLATTNKQPQTNDTSQDSKSTQNTGLTDSALRATPAMVRFSKVMHDLQKVHPLTVLTLECIANQMVWFRENWYEEVLKQLRLGLAKCNNIIFNSKGSVRDVKITPHTLNFIKKLVSTFGIGIEIFPSYKAAYSTNGSFTGSGSESLAKQAQTAIEDPVFQQMKQNFSTDFNFSLSTTMKLHHLISKIKKWIKILECKIRLLPKNFLIEEKSRLLSNFCHQNVEIEIPGECLLLRHSHCYVKIDRFMPTVQIVEKHNTFAKRIVIRGHNGKLYTYLIMQDAGLGDTRCEERVLQLLRMFNHYLTKQKETSRRFLYYTVPRVVAISPHQRFVEDNPSSLSLLDIFKSMSTQPYDCIEHYYQHLSNIQSRGTRTNIKVLKDVFLKIQQNYCQSDILKNWTTLTYATSTDYWMFRKMLTLQLSLSCFTEYVLHLTMLNPNMIYIHQDSGLLNASYFKFDIDDQKGELVSNRPVPFRLTPNFVELVTETGINGPLTASIIATARCFNQPNNKFQSILKAILRDEMITSYKKKLEDECLTDRDEISGDIIISMVTKAVNSIMHRLDRLAKIDSTGNNNVRTIVSAASSVDNLCRMDPAWYPWL